MTVANEFETIEPTSGHDALADTARELAQHMPRDEVVAAIVDLDPLRIMDAVEGRPVEPPLSPVEARLATTVDHYGELMGPSVGVVAALEVFKQDILAGGVFVGEPLPTGHFAPQAAL